MIEYTDYKTKNITNPVVTDYIVSDYKPVSKLTDLRKKSEEEGVPIITKETEAFLLTLLKIIKPQKILEIGTAVGYSSMFFSEQSGAEVYTVEKDEKTADIAVQNINYYRLSDKIHVFCGDGEEMINSIRESGEAGFDFIFIDAAKSHYKRFFDAALKVASDDAVIVCDNVLFQAKVASDEYDQGGKHKTNIRRLREFNNYIMTDSRFATSILAVGDGVSITKVIDKENK